MNVFYVEPDFATEYKFELRGQEAQHAAKVLRFRAGDEIYATNGRGLRLTGVVEVVNKNSIIAAITQKEEIAKPVSEKVLAMGIIKKRDRLEFAVEKAVELGASEIVLFNSEHSEKNKVRLDRLETIAISAMKQSMRSWLPKIHILKSVDEVLKQFPNHSKLMAHEQTGYENQKVDNLSDYGNENLLLLVGPEGGFSESEVDLTQKEGGQIISLGKYRLRAETAAVSIMSLLL